MNELKVTVPVPPSSNNLYTTVNGHRVLSKAGRDYKRDVGWLVCEAVQETPLGITKHSRFHLTMRFWFLANNRDLSNAVKVLEDAIAEAIGINDNRVDELLLVRCGVDRDRPRVEVILEVV